jgi:antitoxin component YwqK of YwqJK toxin-antitoxin module
MNEVKDKLNVPIKGLLFFLVLITFASCNSRKQVDIKNNAGVVIETFFVDKDDPSTKVGAYTKYYDSGKLLETGVYKNGKLNGERKLYHENGKLMQLETYIDDKFDGPFKSYSEDGSLVQEGVYRDNQMNGVWKNYYTNPKNVMKSEMTLLNGKINGPAKEYYTNGKLSAEGNKIEIGDGADAFDVFDGKVQVYDSLGTLEKTITYDKGRQISKEEGKK